mmetsp:Transcript_12475/g.27690  ORF Transcript_12475/g.27690 Transcript_12475/m.27690 type:complete len:227 (+) Transcript_12475:81-761(+)
MSNASISAKKSRKMRKRPSPTSLIMAAVAVASAGNSATTVSSFSTGGSSSHRGHHPMTSVGRAGAAPSSSRQSTVLQSTSVPQEFDSDAYERKNLSRKKFGLKPLSESEFMDLEVEIRAMEAEQTAKAEEMRRSRAAAESPNSRRGQQSSGAAEDGDNIFATITKSLLGEDTCESNFDCPRPKVCCDLGFKKMCCSSGRGIFEPQQQLQRIPVQVVAGNGSGGGQQ